MAVCSQVLAIPEMLEMIMLSLPLKHLLRSGRVSLFWHRLWASSLNIQRALFLKPSQDHPVQLINTMENPGEDECEWETASGGRLQKRPIINPFHNRIFYGHFDPWYLDAVSYRILVHPFIRCDDTVLGSDPAAGWLQTFNRTDASWRNQFFTQPPMTRFDAWCEGFDGPRRYFNVQNPDGLKMSYIQNGLRGHLDSCTSCPNYRGEQAWWP